MCMFMDDNYKIIQAAHDHDFEMIEILGESPFFLKDNTIAYKDCGLDVCIHAPTVDINIASLNEGIKAESVKQMKECIDYAESINAYAITVHAGKIGRNDPPLRKQALEYACQSISELVDYAENVIISVENMPIRPVFPLSAMEPRMAATCSILQLNARKVMTPAAVTGSRRVWLM